MDRRTLLAGTFATVVPSSRTRVFWEPGTMSSPYAGIVTDWLKKHWLSTEPNPVFLGGSGMASISDLLTLHDPYFTIRRHDKIFYIQNGWQEDSGALEIAIQESGIILSPVHIGSTHGLGLDPSHKMYNKHFVRTLWLNWNDPIRTTLDAQIQMDLSWFKAAVAQVEKAKELAA